MLQNTFKTNLWWHILCFRAKFYKLQYNVTVFSFIFWCFCGCYCFPDRNKCISFLILFQDSISVDYWQLLTVRLIVVMFMRKLWTKCCSRKEKPKRYFLFYRKWRSYNCPEAGESHKICKITWEISVFESE